MPPWRRYNARAIASHVWNHVDNDRSRTMLRLSPRFLTTAALLVVALSGCAGTGGSLDDPYQGMNRQVYAFNKAVDEAVLRPVAQGYQAIVPDFVDDAISNFFGNLNDVQNAINNFGYIRDSQRVE